MYVTRYGTVRLLYVCTVPKEQYSSIILHTIAALHSNTCAVWSQHVCTVVHISAPPLFTPCACYM